MLSERFSWRQLIVTLGLVVAMTILAQPALSQGRALQLTGMDGSKLDESVLLKGASIVVVWASWSPRCRDIVERVNAIERSWGDRARVIMVDFQEERPAIESFMSGKSAAVPVFMDPNGAFSKKHAITTLPGFLIYKDGQVAYRGKLPNDADSLIGEILG